MPQVLSDHQRLYDLRVEHWGLLCRRELVPFSVHALAPKRESPARHHRRICQKLESVARGELLRLTVLLPPGAGKTTYTSTV